MAKSAFNRCLIVVVMQVISEKFSIFRKTTQMPPYRYLEEYNIEITQEVRNFYGRILEEIGEDTQREGIVKTPERAAKAMLFLTQGYRQDAVEILKSAMFRESYSEMVIIKDIELYSLCEHHMLPFFGKAHVAYIPDGHIVGLSKIPRVVDVFARRLQVQERLTDDIVECINQTLRPKGVAVVIEAAHMCMMMRGVQKQNSVTTTSGFRGQFEKSETRNEFLKLIGSDLS
jgi:GTP cyclohydrolase I